MRHKHSKVSDPNSFVTHHGDKHRIEYDSFFGPDGIINLKPAGKVDIQAEINSHAAETDMAIIIKRLQMGDTSVLTSKRPMYGDFTDFPDTYAEAFDLVRRSESAFESLPVDIKNQFDNDVGQWFSQIGTDAWMSIMGLVDKPAVDVVPSPGESEVVE